MEKDSIFLRKVGDKGNKFSLKKTTSYCVDKKLISPTLKVSQLGVFVICSGDRKSIAQERPIFSQRNDDPVNNLRRVHSESGESCGLPSQFTDLAIDHLYQAVL